MIVVLFCYNSVFRFIQKFGIALNGNLEKMKLYNVVMNFLACRCVLASEAPVGRRRAAAAHIEPEHETRCRTNGWGWFL